ncbi:MAG: TetR/AcrR family transcriptional regulator [Intestinimonas sp.]|nr:TetR/AcrR family transcriptional regulator [Intestinimonas sp.]
MTVRKNNRTKEQGAETKKLLFESAVKLFGQCEFKDVTVEAITRMAGVTKGTFYVHFDSKDTLYAELFSAYVERMDTQYKAFLDTLPPQMSSSDMMLSLIKEIIDLMTAQIGYDNLRTIYRLQLTNTMNTDSVKGYERKLYCFFQEVLERGLKQGEFKTVLPTEALSRHFVMAIRGLTYEWCIRYPHFDLKQEATAHFRLLLEGIQT